MTGIAGQVEDTSAYTSVMFLNTWHIVPKASQSQEVGDWYPHVGLYVQS